ncbi:unnamed protein product, partial [Medioppia subpectinata]
MISLWSNNHWTEDMNHIYGTLYLGSIAATKDRQVLRDRGIRGILTVMDEPLATKDQYIEITYHFFKAEDFTDEDLLTRFVEAYDIINTFMRAKTGVLVHCRAGISRSATIVISYLMRELHKTFKESMAFVRTRRPIISPNEGFQRQLSLYEWMGCRLDANNRRFRQYLMTTYEPLDGNGVRLYFARLSYVEELTANLELGPKYVCKECGQMLFHEIHVLQTGYWTGQPCGRLFVEPQPWMQELPTGSVEYLKDMDIKCRKKCKKFVVRVSTIHKKTRYMSGYIESAVTFLGHETVTEFVGT